MVDALADPPCEVLRRGVAIEDIVQTGVVELALYEVFDVTEVRDHSVAVQLLGTTADGNDPVMAVQIGAFALVVQLQAMSRRDGKCLFYVIHCG